MDKMVSDGATRTGHENHAPTLPSGRTSGLGDFGTIRRGTLGGMDAAAERLEIDPPLRGWVSDATVTAYVGPCPLIHPPEAATTLVWRTTGDDPPQLFVVGPRTRAAYHEPKDVPVCVRVRLAYGAVSAVLGIPAGQLVDRVVPLTELWGLAGERLHAKLAAVADGPAAGSLVLGAVRHRISAAVPARHVGTGLVAAAARELSLTGSDALGVGQIARRIGLSERHLRTIFAREVGLGPKQYARIRRVRAALSRLHLHGRHQVDPHSRGRQHTDLAGLAAATGYADQAHLTAEFRDLMQVTPGAFVRGDLPTVPC
jgi:AraC-like DNA-binding protein